MSLHTVWDCQWRPSSEESLWTLCQFREGSYWIVKIRELSKLMKHIVVFNSCVELFPFTPV